MSAHLIAISGGSGSGKSWLARQLQARLGENTGLCSLDNFYRDRSHLSPKQRARVNFDNPRAIDWKSLESVLQSCKEGKKSAIPCYDFNTHTRAAKSRALRPARLMIFEGLWLLRNPSVRKHFKHRIFLDCPEDVRFSRRIRRDTAERGRTEESVLKQLCGAVRPMHERYVESQKKWATKVIQHPVTARTVEQLVSEIKQCITPGKSV